MSSGDFCHYCRKATCECQMIHPEEPKKKDWRAPFFGCRSDVYDRLDSDPHFRALVDQLEYILDKAWSTPSELREALIVAATRHEYRTMRPILVDPSEWCLEESVLKALGKPRKKEEE